MNVANLFKRNSTEFICNRNNNITSYVRFYGALSEWVPFIGVCHNIYQVENKHFYNVVNSSVLTRKSYSDLYELLINNSKFGLWGKESFWAGKGMLVYENESGEFEVMMCLTIDVNDPSKINYDALDPQYFRLYINQNFPIAHKSVFNKLNKEFITELINYLPMDIIYTHDINKILDKPSYPKFKTISQMNEYVQNQLNGIIKNART